MDAIIRRPRIITSGGGLPSSPVITYTGPGNVVASATIWWGLRAYSSSTVGTNAIRLRRDGGSPAESDFITLTTGSLDLASITTFKGANNLFVVKLYDQTGSGFDLEQATTANQPKFILSGIGSLPIMRFDSTSFNLASAGSPTLSQPFTSSLVANRTALTGGNQTAIDIGNNTQLGYSSSASTLFMFAGTLQTAAASDSSWHAIQGVFNGASSDINVDGTTNTVNPSTGGASSVAEIGGANTGNNLGPTVDVVEGGCWPIAFSGAQSTSMSSNQHAYWVF